MTTPTNLSASSISTQADEQGAKFTPGPWSFGSHCIEAANGSRVVDIDGGPPMRVADARLIAAAPDMLEALKALDEQWSVDRELGPDTPARPDFPEMHESTKAVWRQIRAAIAKATQS